MQPLPVAPPVPVWLEEAPASCTLPMGAPPGQQPPCLALATPSLASAPPLPTTSWLWTAVAASWSLVMQGPAGLLPLCQLAAFPSQQWLPEGRTLTLLLTLLLNFSLSLSLLVVVSLHTLHPLLRGWVPEGLPVAEGREPGEPLTACTQADSLRLALQAAACIEGRRSGSGGMPWGRADSEPQAGRRRESGPHCPQGLWASA